MNRKQAALDAGYKELTANNARQVIEGHGLNRVSLMRELCQTIDRNGKEGYADPEEPSPLELAHGLIEALSIPMNASLLCQVSNSIETKACAEGVSFTAAHDAIRKAALEHPPPDGRWALWFLNRQLSRTRHAVESEGKSSCWAAAHETSPNVNTKRVLRINLPERHYVK